MLQKSEEHEAKEEHYIESMEAKADKPLLGVFTYDYKGGGALVDEVIEGSPADEAGLDPGCVITMINDKEIKNAQDLVDAVNDFSAGDEVHITYIRHGRKCITKAILGSPDHMDNCNRDQHGYYMNFCHGRWR